MAIRYAANTGNWSSLATWDGGASKPASGDTVVANGKTVTIDEDVDIGSGTIQTLAAGAAASGGSFAVSSNRTLTMNALAGTTTCLSITSGDVTFNGNSTGSAATSSRHGINWTSTGTLTFTGNATGGDASSSYGLQGSAGTINFAGDVAPGTGVNAGNGINAIGGAWNFLSGAFNPGSILPMKSSSGSPVFTFAQNLTNNHATIALMNISSGATATFNGTLTAVAGKNPLIEQVGNITYNGTLTAADGTPVVQCRTSASTSTVNANLVYSADGTPPIYSNATAAIPKIVVHSTNALTWTVAKSGGTRTLSTASGGGGGGCVVGSPIVKGLAQ